MRWLWLGLLLGAVALGFRFWGQEEAGNRAYRRGDAAEAAERYREALAARGGSPRLQYNLGTALLRLGDPEPAREKLTEALDARSLELRARAFYNLGNALVRPPADGELSAESLRAAIDAYRRALLLDAGSDEARWNLELALRRLRKLEENRQSLPGSEEESPAPAEGAGDGQPQRPRRGDGQVPAPESGGAEQSRGADQRSVDAPLPTALAEQVLRAVEERERDLQREKLKRQRKRVSGPDW